MKLVDIVRRFIRNYLVIFALMVICIAVLRQIFIPDETFRLKDIYIYMICALLGTLPSLILYSRKEIPEKEMRLRIILHFVALEAALLTFGNVTGLVPGIVNSIFLAFQIAVIYVLVRFLSGMDDRRTASRINEKLKAMKEQPGDEPEEE